MKKALAGVLGLALLVATGCNTGSTSGGPGAGSHKASDSGPHVGQPNETFSLTVPTLATTLKQGEAKDVNIGIKRGTNVDEDVALKFEDLPKGVTVDPASPTIKHGDKEAKVTIKAGDDAAVGNFTVKVVGHPSKGADATSEMKVDVEKK